MLYNILKNTPKELLGVYKYRKYLREKVVFWVPFGPNFSWVFSGNFRAA